MKEVREENGQLVAEIEWVEARRLRCGRCWLPTSKVHACQARRRWRDLRVRDQELVLSYAPRRVRCHRCGVRVEKIPWAERWQRVDWKTVAAAVKTAVAEGLLRRKWKPLRVIGIDEVSRSKGQRYLTLVYDLERRRLVWIGENRDAETMRRFFAWLGPRKAGAILIVCCDMWAVYLYAVRQNLPRALVVFDRFHVVQHLNRAVDEVRRQAWRNLRGEEKVAFKRTRWLWLKNPWNLRREEKRRLSSLCRKNSPIVRAYYLKEAFQRFWDYKSEGWSAPYLEQWLWWASHCRLEPFMRFARMIRQHLIVSHRAYGFRTVETYITAIWHGCGELPLE